MKTKFIKENWSVQSFIKSGDILLGNSLDCVFVSSLECNIKPALVFGENKNECEERAKLIAAAPDLFKACIQILDEYEKFYQKDSNMLTRSNLDKLKLAIKKATE